ncbi:MAG TPA: hypothetical protein GXZ90_10395 [Clostridiales bacterium]|nr:hypothetical protein [Clostridiales bacterium]
MKKRFLTLGLSLIIASSAIIPVSASERIIEKQYNTAQFVPEGYSIEEVLQNKNVVEPYWFKDYIIASEVKLHSKDCYPDCKHGAPYIEWWSNGWVSVIDKDTHDDLYHYTNACVVSRQSGGTIFAESGRKYGYGKVGATSDYTHSYGEARIFWGWE